MNVGFPVVHRAGNDSEIYRIDKINDDETCSIVSYINGRSKLISISQLREAEDEELMIGSRIKRAMQ